MQRADFFDGHGRSELPKGPTQSLRDDERLLEGEQDEKLPSVELMLGAEVPVENREDGAAITTTFPYVDKGHVSSQPDRRRTDNTVFARFGHRMIGMLREWSSQLVL